MSDADREKWDAKYRAGAGEALIAPAWLDELDRELPRSGRSLDIAAGRGRIARWCAARGLDALAVDISPVGLSEAAAAAEAAGTSIRTQPLDLETGPLPDGPFALVTCFRYRQMSLWPAIRERLAPGGFLVAEIATVRNLERHEKPPRRFLLEPNELLGDAAVGLEVVYYREGWLGGFHLARLAARTVAP